MDPGADGRLAAAASRIRRRRRPSGLPELPRCSRPAVAAAAAVEPRLFLGFQQVADTVDQVQQQFVRVLCKGEWALFAQVDSTQSRLILCFQQVADFVI